MDLRGRVARDVAQFLALARGPAQVTIP
jgi:hypothetical protein